MKDDLIGGVGAEVVYLWLEDALEILGTVDVEVLDASEEPEGGEHSDESEDMVSVQMGEEDSLEMRKTES